MSKKQTIAPSETLSSHQLHRFRIPHGPNFSRMRLVGFDKAGKTGLVKATLYIDGSAVDAQTRFHDVSQQPLNILGGAELRMYALVLSDVWVDVITEVGANGVIELDNREYEGMYSRKNAATYVDKYNSQGRDVKLVYMEGRAQVQQN